MRFERSAPAIRPKLLVNLLASLRCVSTYTKIKIKKRYPPSEQKTQNLGEVIFPEFALTGGREMGVQILLCWIDLSLRRNLFSLVMQCKMASGLFRLRSNATENGPRRVSTAR